jgi:hypothetical protein
MSREYGGRVGAVGGGRTAGEAGNVSILYVFVVSEKRHNVIAMVLLNMNSSHAALCYTHPAIGRLANTKYLRPHP